MIEDSELLRRFVEEKSEEAFAEVVRRRIGLVYSVAQRQVGGDAHLAHDVTQKVFVDLARKAPTLLGRAVLSGWLYRSTQFAASDVVRAERRRRAREQESQIMNETTWAPEEHADWDKVRPLLDDALGALPETDRDAVALRFFEGRHFAEIGQRLHLTEEAARKRVDRALDKLATALSRRGVTSTTAALGAALAGQAAAAAPAGLAASVTSVSLATGAVLKAGGAFLGFTTAGKIGFAAVTVAAALGTTAALYQWRALRADQAALVQAQHQEASLRSRLRTLEQHAIASQQRAQAAEDDNAKLLAAIDEARKTLPLPADAGLNAEEREVEERYKRALELVHAGQWETALTELLWCYDEGMMRNTSYSGMRLTVVLGEVVKVAKVFPPALTALRQRRDRAEQRILANADENAAIDFLSLNRALAEDARGLALLDRLPVDHPQRRLMMRAGGFNLLVDVQRYGDAIRAVPYERMVPWFERESRPPNVAKEPYPETVLKRHRRVIVTDAARSVEVLAGAGDLGHAREFAARVLAFDGSSDTRDLLRRHLERAGHPELLAAGLNP